MAKGSLFRTTATSTIVAAWLCVCSLVAAQQYQADPVDDKARLLGPIAQNCVREPARYAADNEKFREYFEKYFFPAMTRYSPVELGELGRMRGDLLNRFLWASRDERLQIDLTKMAYDAMVRNLATKYHPAVRYNAILILGQLDDQYAIETAADRRPPKPHKDANKQLTKVVEIAASGKRVPPSLLVGALLGLERHARFHDSLDKSSVDAMTTAVVQLAANDDLFPEVDAKVVEWIQLQAATVLATLGSPGRKGEVQAVLAKLIAGETAPKMSVDARCQVAALLARMKYEGATVDGAATSDALLKLAVDVATDEAKLAKEFDDSQISGSGFGGPGGRRRGRIKVDLETQQVQFDVRVLLARLGDLRSGFTAAKPIVPADKQTVFDAVIAAINPVIAAAQDADAVGLQISRAVQAMAGQIQSAVKPGSAPAESNDAGAVF